MSSVTRQSYCPGVVVKVFAMGVLRSLHVIAHVGVNNEALCVIMSRVELCESEKSWKCDT